MIVECLVHTYDTLHTQNLLFYDQVTDHSALYLKQNRVHRTHTEVKNLDKSKLEGNREIDLPADDR